MMPHLHIELQDLTLKFVLLDNPIAQLWQERMTARGSYPLDHPDRFYGFNNLDEEISRAERYIQDCINTINAHETIIEQPFTTCFDQDRLNYYHSIFERYHGLLDQQDTEFWNGAPDAVRKALSDLNLAVHRCESTVRPPLPRFVCTWYGMPKIKQLPNDLMQEHGTMYNNFGTVYLNYCEIGKTLEDLTYDRDNYIGDDAFKPFDFYSADFVVRFFTDSDNSIQTKLKLMNKYYNQHRNFFAEHGYTNFHDPKLLPLKFPIATLETSLTKEQVLAEIQKRQYISRVYIQ